MQVSGNSFLHFWPPSHLFLLSLRQEVEFTSIELPGAVFQELRKGCEGTECTHIPMPFTDTQPKTSCSPGFPQCPSSYTPSHQITNHDSQCYNTSGIFPTASPCLLSILPPAQRTCPMQATSTAPFPLTSRWTCQWEVS